MKKHLQHLLHDVRDIRHRASKSKDRRRLYQEILLKDAEYRIILAIGWEKR